MSKNYFLINLLVFSILLCTINTSGITYEYEFNGEPAGDVTQIDEYGNSTIVDGYPEIDIKRFESKNGTGDNLTFILGTKAKSITTAPYVKYVIRIFTQRDNRSGYNITYSNGSIEILKIINEVEQAPVNITSLGGIIKDKNEYVLQVDIPKSVYFPETELDYFNVDAFSWMEEGNLTFVDYIHNIPGNPGTISRDIIDDTTNPGPDDGDKEGEGSSLILAVLVIVIILVIAILIILRSRKKNSD